MALRFYRNIFYPVIWFFLRKQLFYTSQVPAAAFRWTSVAVGLCLRSRKKWRTNRWLPPPCPVRSHSPGLGRWRKVVESRNSPGSWYCCPGRLRGRRRRPLECWCSGCRGVGWRSRVAKVLPRSMWWLCWWLKQTREVTRNRTWAALLAEVLSPRPEGFVSWVRSSGRLLKMHTNWIKIVYKYCYITYCVIILCINIVIL